MGRPRLCEEKHNSDGRFNGSARHGIGRKRREGKEGMESMA